MIMACQYRFTNCNKCATLVVNICNGEAMVGYETEQSLHLPPKFCQESKTALIFFFKDDDDNNDDNIGSQSLIHNYKTKDPLQTKNF